MGVCRPQKQPGPWEMKPEVKSITRLAGVKLAAELAPEQTYQRNAPTQTLIADPAAESFRTFFERQQATQPAQYLYKIDNATVFGKGAICLEGGVVRENLEGAPVNQILKLAQECSQSPFRVLEEPVLYTTRYGVKNYGHCLTDIVPRIVQTIRLMPDIRIALHPEFVPTARSALLALGCQADKIIFLDEQTTRIRHGFYASPCNIHPLIHAPSSLDIIRHAYDEKTLIRHAPFKAEKLFITRKDAGTRHLINHANLADVLRCHGFVEVAVGGMSHLEQAALFHQAREIIGLAGASLTNVLYCRPGTRMTVLAPATMPALYFWDISAQIGVDFRIGYFPVETASPGIHADFLVDPTKLPELAGL